MTVHLLAGDIMDYARAEPVTGTAERPTCPRCRGTALPGFGLAHGGYGSYWSCRCGWVYKESSETESNVEDVDV